MYFSTFLTSFLKSKWLISAIIGIALFSGATVAAFASPTGQQFLHTKTATPTVSPGNHGHTDNAHPGGAGAPKACPGQPEAALLATKFGLSTAPNASAMLTICALHQGTFKGTSSKGTAVTSQHALGYGDIEQVVAQAQQLATKAGQKLNDGNVAQLVADALQSCSVMPLMQCLRDHPH